LISCFVYSSTMKMEALYSSQRLANFQWATWRYIPEDISLRNHRCENLKSDHSRDFPPFHQSAINKTPNRTATYTTNTWYPVNPFQRTYSRFISIFNIWKSVGSQSCQRTTYDHESCGTRSQESLCWRGPAVI
jgi:hypothetical protein